MTTASSYRQARRRRRRPGRPRASLGILPGAGKVVKLRPGAHVWHIIGNSRSLREESGLEELHPSIGVNRILRYMTPDYLLIVDSNVRNEEWERVKKFKGSVITWERLRRWRRKVITFSLRERSYGAMKAFEGPFERYGNTGVYAIEFAARQIYPDKGQIILHGIDLVTPRKGESHCFKMTHAMGCSGMNWPKALICLRGTAEFLSGHGIRLLNASPWHGPLDKIMPRLSP